VALQGFGRALKCGALLLDAYPVTSTLLRVRVRAYAAFAVASLAIAGVVVGLAQPSLGDYVLRGSNPDNAAPAMDALIHGDLARLAAVQPVMGPVSLIVRAPFAALGHAIGGHTLEYDLGAVACLGTLAAVALLLAARVRRRDGGFAAPIAVVLVLVANPLTIAGALDAGHPEELLAAALAAAAVLAAAEDRATLTGVLLGLGLATKPWAALAVPAALLALKGGHRRALGLALALATVLIAPLAAADPHRLLDGSRELGRTVRVYPPSAWWPFASPVHAPNLAGVAGAHAWSMPWGLTRSAGELVAGALALGAGIVHVRRRRALPVEAALAFLAAAMLARCVFDPMNLAYYAVPFVAALVGWETSIRRGLPVCSALVSVVIWGTVMHTPANPVLACALYLAWSLPLMAYLLTRRGSVRAVRTAQPLKRPFR
jgi:hypothetical protein